MKTFPTRSESCSLLIALAFLVSLCIAPSSWAEQAGAEVSEAKQTTLGLYLTASEAYSKWQANPDSVMVIDVRTTEEYLYVGHAPMAWNVPFASQTYEWDAEKRYFDFQPNPAFITQVKEIAGESDTILVMCRSGGRSAMAVNRLTEAGFSNVYQIIDGFEGDPVKDAGSVYNGQRLRNGWKNSGIPWTYQPDPERMRFADGLKKE